MNVKKSLMVAGAVATIGVAGIAGLGVASAATDSNKSDSLIDKIAAKFNVDKSEVKAVFDEERAEREAEHQQKLEERLSELVKDGKLTEDQKAKILAKHAELKAAMESERETLQDKTKEEVRTLMQQRQEELKKWAEENGIPIEYLPFAQGSPHKHGGMMIKEKAFEDSPNE